MNTVVVKMLASGQKRTVVPVSSEVPISRTEYFGIPHSYACSNNLPSLRTCTCNNELNALTQETPTPCNPPETLYVFLSNLPPACNTVITTSNALFFSLECIPVGIPLPSSFTETELSS